MQIDADITSKQNVTSNKSDNQSLRKTQTVTYTPFTTWEKVKLVAAIVFTLPLLCIPAYYYYKYLLSIHTVKPVTASQPLAPVAAKVTSSAASQGLIVESDEESEEEEIEDDDQPVLGAASAIGVDDEALDDQTHLSIPSSSSNETEIGRQKTDESQVSSSTDNVQSEMQKEIERQTQLFTDEVEAIKKKIGQGLILADEIGKLHENGVPDILNNFSAPLQPERKQQLQKIIYQAIVERERRQKSKMLANIDKEISLLQSLGFKIDQNNPYYDKEIIYQVIIVVVDAEMIAKQATSPGEAKRIMKRMALKARFEAVPCENELKFNKFELCLNFAQKIRGHEWEQEPTVLLPDDFPQNCVEGRQYFENDYDDHKQDIVEIILRNFFKDFVKKKKYFGDSKCDVKQFTAMLAKKEKEVLDKIKNGWLEARNGDKFTQPLIRFYQSYGQFIKIELNQGKDPHAVLGNGVCWATNNRLQVQIQRSPMGYIPTSDELLIVPHDRFDQATYQVKQASNVESDELPEEGEKWNRLFEKVTLDHLSKAIQENAQRLRSTAGCLYLKLYLKDSAHAMTLRLDLDNKKFWLLDRNIAFFDFDDLGPEAANKAIECLIALIKALYPKIKSITGDQLILKNKKKSVAFKI